VVGGQGAALRARGSAGLGKVHPGSVPGGSALAEPADESLVPGVDLGGRLQRGAAGGVVRRGVDVGAKVEVYKQIIHFAETGASILLVSSELPELLGLSDRILVLNGGRLVGNLVRAAATHERVLALSTEENPPSQIVEISK